MKTKQPAPQGPVITNCSFVNEAPKANEHTRAAVVALAEAAQANANAIAKIAEALKGQSVTHYGPMLSVGGSDGAQ
jgi:hypothetical protein